MSRHHYYLQLRENVLVHRQSACSQEGWLLLAGWALQADIGNYPDQRLSAAAAAAAAAYFQPADYFPKWVRESPRGTGHRTWDWDVGHRTRDTGHRAGLWDRVMEPGYGT